MGPTSDFGSTLRPSRRDLVLVVADDAATAANLSSRLQEDGYSVVSAASGPEAMAMLPMTRPTVLVIALSPNAASAFRCERVLPAVFLTSAERARSLADAMNVRPFASAASMDRVPETIEKVVSASIAW